MTKKYKQFYWNIKKSALQPDSDIVKNISKRKNILVL